VSRSISSFLPFSRPCAESVRDGPWASVDNTRRADYNGRCSGGVPGDWARRLTQRPGSARMPIY